MNLDAVASASIQMNLASVQLEASTSIVKKTMDFQTESMEMLVADMLPDLMALRHSLDVKV